MVILTYKNQGGIIYYFWNQQKQSHFFKDTFKHLISPLWKLNSLHFYTFFKCMCVPCVCHLFLPIFAAISNLTRTNWRTNWKHQNSFKLSSLEGKKKGRCVCEASARGNKIQSNKKCNKDEGRPFFVKIGWMQLKFVIINNSTVIWLHIFSL